jgi:hypothetical protein
MGKDVDHAKQLKQMQLFLNVFIVSIGCVVRCVCVCMCVCVWLVFACFCHRLSFLTINIYLHTHTHTHTHTHMHTHTQYVPVSILKLIGFGIGLMSYTEDIAWVVFVDTSRGLVLLVVLSVQQLVTR